MSVYMTEEEQLEVIKKWWKKNGTLLTIVISIILIGFSGYKYMQAHQEKRRQQASVAYENMMLSFSKQNIKAVRSYANELIKEFNHSVYADVAHMTLAKVYVTKNKLDRAKNELYLVADQTKMLALKQIAKLRIARILASEKAYTKALTTLGSIDDKTYLPLINELKGDIYGAQGQYKEAINAYRLAIDEVKTNGMGNLFLEMKTNELAIRDQSMRADFQKIQNA